MACELTRLFVILDGDVRALDAHVYEKLLVNPDPPVSLVAQWARELEMPIMLVFAAVVSLGGRL